MSNKWRVWIREYSKLVIFLSIICFLFLVPLSSVSGVINKSGNPIEAIGEMDNLPISSLTNNSKYKPPLDLSNVDGERKDGMSDSPYKILLKSRQFEPARGVDPFLESRLSELAKAKVQKAHVLIQFDHIPNKAERKTLKENGVKLLSYIPNKAWTASIPIGRSKEISALQNVKWIGEILPEDKIAPSVREKDFTNVTLNPDGTVNLSIMFFEDTSLDEAFQVISDYGGLVTESLPLVNVLKVTIPIESISDLANDDSVMWINQFYQPEVDNNGSRAAIGIDVVQLSPYNLDGTGVVVGEWDAGHADSAHDDFEGRVTFGDSASVDYHATHVAGTVLGDGTLSSAKGGTPLQWRGIATNATLVSYEWWYSVPELYSDYSTAINTYGIDLSTNSWGYGYGGTYEEGSQALDNITRGALGKPISILGSAGNSGPGWWTVRTPNSAKNMITVGATNSNDDSLTSWSSRGPAEGGGRLKPDVVAPGCQVGGDGGITSTFPGDNYAVLCGTSMSTPATSGSVALMIQDYRSTQGVDPLPSTIKALLIHTAKDLGNTGPDFSYGYGRINVTKAIDLLRSDTIVNNVILEDNITHDKYVLYDIEVLPGQPELKVTLVWDDYPGTPNAAKVLVNDLNLVLVSLNSTSYYPWILDPANPSNPATTGVDDTNNVEQIVVNSPVGGIYRLTVNGSSVPFGPQNFSVVVSYGSLVSRKGIVDLDSAKYKCSSTVGVTLVDEDLNSDNATVENATVNITSTTETTPEVITLIELGVNTAKFMGSFSLTTGTPVMDGVLQVAHGDMINATYYDADDGTGNSSYSTDTAIVDCLPPVMTIISPQNVTYISRFVSLNFTGTDESGIDWTGYSLDGAATVTSGNRILTGLSDGPHNVVVYANDTVGNLNSSTMYFAIDAPPTITIVSPLNLSHNKRDLDFNITVDEELTNAFVSIDGGSNNIMTNSSVLDYYNVTIPTLDEGSHMATFYANDTDGNISSSMVWFTVDTTPPGITINKPPNATVTDEKPEIDVTISEASKILYSFDGENNILGALRDTEINIFYGESIIDKNTSMLFHMNEGSGNYVNDLSPNGNNGTIYGASWTTGRFGSALSFDGIDDYVEVPHSDSLDFVNSPFTVSVWINTFDFKSSSIISKYDGNKGFRMKLQSNGQIGWGLYSNGGSMVFSDPIDANKWHYVVGMFDGAIRRLYVDGECWMWACGSYRSGPGNTTIDLSIGSGYSGNFLGKIDEVHILNRILSVEEIVQEYEKGMKELSDGPHNFTVFAEDAAENLNSSTVYFTVDLPPIITIESPENRSYNTGNIDFNITVDKSLTNAFVSIDGGSNNSMTNDSLTHYYNVMIPTLGEGSHNATFYANTPLGTMSSTTRYFTVDLTPPTITITSPPNETIHENKPYLNATISETADVWYDLDGREYNVTLCDDCTVASETIKSESNLDANSVMLLHMNEGLNTYVYDSSPNENNGTIQGATWATGKFGYGLLFDGNDYVKVPDLADGSLDFDWQSFTIEAWIKTDDTNGVIVNKGLDKSGATNRTAYHLFLNNVGKLRAMLHQNGTDFSVIGSKVNDNEWHHVAVVYDFGIGNATLYVDGDFDNTGSFAGIITEPPVNDRPLYIGSLDLEWSSTWNYTGIIDEVHIIRRALNATEIRQKYEKVLEDGPYHITVYANDMAGNLNSSTVYFTILQITTESPLNKTYNTGDLDFNITLASPLTNALVSIDGGSNNTMMNDTATHWYNVSIPPLEEGFHNATFWVNSTLGLSAAKTVYFTVDTTPPQITINSPLNTTISDNTPTLNATEIDDNPDTIWYSIDGMGNLTTNRTSFEIEIAGEGFYTGWDFSLESENSDPYGITTNGTYIWVGDWEKGSGGKVYRYDMNSNYIDNFTCPNADGVTTNNAYIWCSNWDDRTVHKYYMNGTDTGENFSVSEMGPPGGPGAIYQNGTHFFITDWYSKIYVYDLQGNYITNYTLNEITCGAGGITSDGNYFWVTDCEYWGPVYKYYLNFTYTSESWNTITESDNWPAGIMTYGNYFLVLNNDNDDVANRVYKYYMNGLEDGQHNITVYANDTAGWMNSTTRHFTVDVTPPSVTITSPQNMTYASSFVELNFSTFDSSGIDWTGYSLDGAATVTSGNTTLTGLSDGPHNVVVYANDTVGNMGSNATWFTVQVPIRITSLITDKTDYSAGETVTIIATVVNNDDIVHKDLNLEFLIKDPNGMTVFTDTKTIKRLNSGQSKDVSTQYNLPSDAANGIYTVEAIVYDQSQTYDMAQTTFEVVGGEQPSQTMHVQSIEFATKQKGRTEELLITVTIYDNSSNPISDVIVDGTLTLPDLSTESYSGITVTDGTVTFKYSQKNSALPTGNYTFCVDDVTKSGSIYNSTKNVETCDTRNTGNYTMSEVAYEWLDGVTGGTSLNLGDDDSSTQTLPFTFNFYGDEFSTIYISSNGYADFIYPSPQEMEGSIPSTYEEHQKLIAPLWDDWDPDASDGDIYVKTFTNPNRFVVTWNELSHYDDLDDNPSTFQFVLYESGEIRFNYNTVGYTDGVVTVGLNEGDGIRYNNYPSVPLSGSSILFSY